MNIYFSGWRFRHSAPIEPPKPDHSLKHEIKKLYSEASHHRRVALSTDTPYREVEQAREESSKLIKQITELAMSKSDDYRKQVQSFEDRGATVQQGQSILFLDPDTALQDPHVAGPAGVNHPGRKAVFTWNDAAVDQLVRILHHTHARIVLTAKWRNRATMRTNLNRELNKRGLPVILGRTNYLDSKGGRPSEVIEFLDSYVDGGSVKGATIHGWCVLDEQDFIKHKLGPRFHGHYVSTHPKEGISKAVADKIIEVISGVPLNSSKRAFVVKPFKDAPGLQYAIDYKKNRPGKSKDYKQQYYSDEESDNDAEDTVEDEDDNDDSFRVPTTNTIANAKSAREESIQYG